jgi:calcineurin-like phosphoesterase family protein
MMFFTGDTHFGDPRVLRLDRGPFSNMEERDAALIRNWKRRSAPKTRLHLGDVMAAKAGSCNEILRKLTAAST